MIPLEPLQPPFLCDYLETIVLQSDYLKFASRLRFASRLKFASRLHPALMWSIVVGVVRARLQHSAGVPPTQRGPKCIQSISKGLPPLPIAVNARRVSSEETFGGCVCTQLPQRLGLCHA